MNAGQKVGCLSSMHWTQSPLVRAIFFAFEEDERMQTMACEASSARSLLLPLVCNLGDSRMVENVHQHARDLMRSSKAKRFANTTLFAHTLRSGCLEQRQVSTVTVDAASKVMEGRGVQGKLKPIAEALNSRGHKLSLELQNLMKPKDSHNKWPSPTPAALFQSVASTIWLFNFWDNPAYAGHGVEASWLSVLLVPGCVIAQNSKGLLLKVVAVAEYSFLAWSLEVEKNSAGESVYRCFPRKHDLAWHHIVDLQDWVALKTEAVLQHELGPVVWRSIGEALPLEVVACLEGLTLTAKQSKALLKHFNITIPSGQPTIRALHTLIIESLLPQDLQKQALDKLTAKEKAQEVEWDTDFSEIVSELGQEDGNAQDVKEYKKKKLQAEEKT